MKGRKFDSRTQHVKYKVLREIAKEAWSDNLLNTISEIPERVMPGNEPTMRCCIYKERAIISERIKRAMAGNKKNESVIDVIKIACDDCPTSGYEVTELCRGCIAHKCENICPKGAITFDKNQKAHIDKDKCIDCGKCASVCPYLAIQKRTRPCEVACKVSAIHKGKDGAAEIDYDKCISCGACVTQCPFGAVTDKSYILDVIKLLKESDNNKKYKVYAIVAPSIAGQFTYAKLGQIISGIKEIGFYDIVEVALGADIVTYLEAKELIKEKKLLTSSCCPAFVNYIKKNFKTLENNISNCLSPMAEIAKYLKEKDENCKVVFIGPCTAKKEEIKEEKVQPLVDSVLTFEELQALFDSKNIEISELEEKTLEDASYYGRIFARSGGLAEAIKEAVKEQNVQDFECNVLSCDGIEECKIALLKASKNLISNNFIEGMACKGGCIGGAGCLTHDEKNKKAIDEHGKKASKKTIIDSVKNICD